MSVELPMQIGINFCLQFKVKLFQIVIENAYNHLE